MKMRTLTVSELNQYIKGVIDSDILLSNIKVEGEISNFVAHSSGHAYFSLKDDDSKINCVMFNRNFSTVDFDIKNGQKVEAIGNVSIYTRDGKLQLYVNALEEGGLGKLHIKFEEMKKEFMKKGYFEDDRKKDIPKFPDTIGIITAPEGAAIRDIISVFNRRTTLARCLIYPVHVQGDYAKGEIVKAIDYFNNEKNVDVIILSRGGGSIEELWAFNEPTVVEAIYHSTLPIITGVGHETDYTLADFVSDLRAPTPSSAAEVALQSSENLLLSLQQSKNKLIKNYKAILDQKRKQLEQLKIENFVANELKAIENKYIHLDNIHLKMNQLIGTQLNHSKNKLETLTLNLSHHIKNKMTTQKNRLEKLLINLNHNNPINVLEKGYSITYDADEHVINDVSQMTIGNQVTTKLKSGSFDSTIVKIRKDNDNEKL